MTFHSRLLNVVFFNYVENLYLNVNAVATGWGTLKEDGKPSCILQEVEVPVLSNQLCVKDTNYTDKMITENMLCAGYPGLGTKDSCQVIYLIFLFLFECMKLDSEFRILNYVLDNKSLKIQGVNKFVNFNLTVYV